MRCFAEWNEAKYGRAKCNERTAYTVLGEPNGAIVERECNVPCVFLKNLSVLFRFWWAFYYCIWFFCFEKWKRGWGWIPFFKTPLFFLGHIFKLLITSNSGKVYFKIRIVDFINSYWIDSQNLQSLIGQKFSFFELQNIS